MGHHDVTRDPCDPLIHDPLTNCLLCQSLLEFVDIVDLHLVHMLLHDSQILQSMGFRSGLLGALLWKNYIRCFTLQQFDCVTRR